jgi:hypothetical protein
LRCKQLTISQQLALYRALVLRALFSADGPVVRIYACTPADGTLEQQGGFRRQKFLAALIGPSRSG